MRAPPPPIRFLALVLGGWIGLRAAMLMPGWWREAAPVRIAAAAAMPPLRPPAPLPMAAPIDPPAVLPRAAPMRRSARPAPPAALPVVSLAPPFPAPVVREVPALLPPPPRPRPARRWSVSASLLIRDDRGGAALAPGGTLGGSQAGMRLLYRLGGDSALSARLYAPLRQMSGAEAAIGLDWSPVRAVHLLAERRQRLGPAGRSAFALSIYGGVSRALPRGLRLDAYGQAGMVGARSRDLFADGSAIVSAPFGPVEIGGGAWGGAQPGAARLDAGPRLSWRLPVRGAELRLQADWRFRIAGDAAPGSGPALTVSAGF